jgi:RNA polymerase sigma-70 factor (ECF subfamily)
VHLRREETHRAGLEEAFRRDRGFLRALLYRMTGVGADADDLLQETFRRAWERPPLDPDRPLRPWLTTVAMNLARDHLRQRRRQPYIGPWLPGIDPEAATTELSASARYDQKESASLAFLLALEALTPNARGVLVLRDVCDLSVEETAVVTGLSEVNVRTTHRRARQVLGRYEAQKTARGLAPTEAAEAVAYGFFSALVSGDLQAIQAALSEGVELKSDTGGVFMAARRPIHGPRRVASLLYHLGQKVPTLSVEPCPYNARIGWRITHAERPDGRQAPESWMGFDQDARGQIVAIYLILAPRKLSRATLSER